MTKKIVYAAAEPKSKKIRWDSAALPPLSNGCVIRSAAEPDAEPQPLSSLSVAGSAASSAIDDQRLPAAAAIN